MKIDRYINDLLSLIEKNSGGQFDSYELLPQLIRGEIKEIKWTPALCINDKGGCDKITSAITVTYNEK
jgi:hypothetical protein